MLLVIRHLGYNECLINQMFWQAKIVPGKAKAAIGK
jgi:hypothetical protein